MSTTGPSPIPPAAHAMAAPPFLETASELKHKFPYCVYVMVHKGAETPQADLVHLTISFGEEEIKSKLGVMRFGISRGILRFSINNGTMPYSRNNFASSLSFDVTLEYTTSLKTAHKDAFEDKTSAKASAVPEGGVETKQSQEHLKEIISGTKHTSSRAQVRTQGPEATPEFVFQLQDPAKTILEGTLNRREMGVIAWHSTPRSVDVDFSTGHSDIKITAEDSSLLGALTPMKRRIILARIKKEMRSPQNKLSLCNGVVHG